MQAPRGLVREEDDIVPMRLRCRHDGLNSRVKFVVVRRLVLEERRERKWNRGTGRGGRKERRGEGG